MNGVFDNEEIRYNKLKEENEYLKKENERLRAEIENLIEDKIDLRREISHLEDRLSYVDYLV